MSRLKHCSIPVLLNCNDSEKSEPEATSIAWICRMLIVRLHYCVSIIHGSDILSPSGRSHLLDRGTIGPEISES